MLWRKCILMLRCKRLITLLWVAQHTWFSCGDCRPVSPLRAVATARMISQMANMTIKACMAIMVFSWSSNLIFVSLAPKKEKTSVLSYLSYLKLNKAFRAHEYASSTTAETTTEAILIEVSQFIWNRDIRRRQSFSELQIWMWMLFAYGKIFSHEKIKSGRKSSLKNKTNKEKTGP